MANKELVLEDYGSDNPEVNEEIVVDFIDYLKELYMLTTNEAYRYALSAIMIGEVEGQVSDGEFEDMGDYELEWSIVIDLIHERYLENTNLNIDILEEAIKLWDDVYRQSLYFGGEFCKSLIEPHWPDDWAWLDNTLENYTSMIDEDTCDYCGTELDQDGYCPNCDYNDDDDDDYNDYNDDDDDEYESTKPDESKELVEAKDKEEVKHRTNYHFGISKNGNLRIDINVGGHFRWLDAINDTDLAKVREDIKNKFINGKYKTITIRTKKDRLDHSYIEFPITIEDLYNDEYWKTGQKYGNKNYKFFFDPPAMKDSSMQIKKRSRQKIKSK